MGELPRAFLERMQEYLPQEEYENFLESYNKEPEKGIRANLLKIDPDSLYEMLPEEFKAHPVTWCPTGFYISNDSRPGKKAQYYTGLYYPQEPSAMSSAEALNVRPGDMVLDLCAAPGGKSTQLAGKLKGEGILFLNEITGKRVSVLAQNVERMGVPNAVILNENPEKLKDNFFESFDKILVDAPCSGEGMFRKDEKVRDEWSPERPRSCSKVQRQILSSVDALLKPGGELVYSTCTFAPEEDEQVIEWLVNTGRYEILPIELNGIETTGRKEFTSESVKGIEDTVRIWPHLNDGEGHFVARLKKLETETESSNRRFNRKRLKKRGNPEKGLRRANRKHLSDFLDFCEEYLPNFDTENIYRIDDRIYKLPEGINENILYGIKVYSPGLFLGELKKNRFEPSHTLAMSLKKEDFSNIYELSEDELWSYLKGEEIKPLSTVKPGWVLMCYEGYPVGLGKMSGVIKNKYPKGLRIYKK